MKKLSSEINRENADNVLKSFLSELSKNGFSKGIKKYLNLAWQEDNLFSSSLKKLNKISFSIGKIKFIELAYSELIYRYEVEINDKIIKISVQPLHEIGVPYEKGFYGVIPAKLFILENNTKKNLTEKEEEEIAKKSLIDAIHEVEKQKKNIPKESKKDKEKHLKNISKKEATGSKKTKKTRK